MKEVLGSDNAGEPGDAEERAFPGQFYEIHNYQALGKETEGREDNPGGSLQRDPESIRRLTLL